MAEPTTAHCADCQTDAPIYHAWPNGFYYGGHVDPEDKTRPCSGMGKPVPKEQLKT